MKKKPTPSKIDLEEMIPNPEHRKLFISRLYSGQPLFGKNGSMNDLVQAFVNAALQGEADAHLESEEAKGNKNRLNGKKHKTVMSGSGPLSIETPRDRAGTFEPTLVGPWERKLHTGVDNIILSFYARGQSISDIQHQLQELYGVELSTGQISTITDRVWETVTEWQQRPLNSFYSIVYLDAIHYKVREEGRYITKAIYTVLGVDAHGQRDVLGLYLEKAEGACTWGLVLEDLQRRGVEDLLFVCVDGLKGFAETITTVFPNAIVQRCIVHMVRNSVRFVPDKNRKAVCRDLRKVYTAATRSQAEIALEAFHQAWGKQYPEIKKKWHSSWNELMAFMDYQKDIRRMIYTTNPVESLHRVLRKVTKTKGAWINDKALIKQLYLILTYNEKSWKRKARGWIGIQRDLSAKFGERYLKHL